MVKFRVVPQRLVAIAHDSLAIAVCWYAAYWLRFNLDVPDEFRRGADVALPIVITVHAPIYWLMGLYLGIWRYASLMDLRRIIVAVGLAAVVTVAAMLMLRMSLVPRSVLILHPILLIVLMGGGRFVYRAWKDRALYGRIALMGEPVLVIGAGDGADRLLRELAHSCDWRVVGLLADIPRRMGHELRGVKVLGPISELARWAVRLEVRRAIVAMPEDCLSKRRHAMEAAVQAGLSVLTVPSLEDMLAGHVSISQMRQVQLEDLLGREPVQLDDVGVRGLLKGRTVLITGAGGSIGAELARQIARFKPRQLVLFELSEFALYEIEQELQNSIPGLSLVCAVGDVKNRARLKQIFSAYRPAVVFHAAAYKHVPLMENGNSWEAVRNNVLGSKCVAEVSVEYGVDKFVLISTDKAVNPTNVMGATKRLAERVLRHLQRPGSTRFVTVRFGNVLGSNGSVIPKFREQIAKGGPVTVTHPDIIRYFMLIPEAAQLVLQAGLMGQGGEIFVLEMGEPIRIADLARDMIRLSGFTEDEVKIVFTGLRPGEKLFEELLSDNEHSLPTHHPKLRIALAEASPDFGWQALLENWLEAPSPGDEVALKTQLKFFVPEYSPQLPAGVMSRCAGIEPGSVGSQSRNCV